MVVQALMSEHGMSERRACQASGIARSTLRYRPVACDDSGVITFIQTHMALNPRHGFGLLYDSARHRGKPPSQEPQLTLFKAQDRKRGLQREIDWDEVEQQLKNYLHQPNPMPVREVSKQLDIETRFLYLKCNQTALQIGQRWLNHQKHRRQARLAKAMPYLEAAGLDVLKEGKALNLREVTTRVPAEVLSGVQGLYEVLRDVKSRVGHPFVPASNDCTESPKPGLAR
ncbi:hypothetical protein [Diaphorobacter sp.]|uniref:hypothetical protein n=2 Tax=Diaphorobacter sp. TaxID=1934310 RepID=UPI002589B6CC|nr:hypothetical protein [Diaphorobacter sp.]